MSKPKVAFYWAASCGGCEESIVDLAEDLLAVAQAVEIVLWPVAMDFKYEDIEKLKDGEISLSLINGAVRLSEQEEIVKLLRRKSKLVIAHGSCAHLGGIVGLANFYSGQEVINRAYKEVPSLANQNNELPTPLTVQGNYQLELPEFYNTVKPLNQIIEVDYYLPGCPPTPKLIKNAFMAVLEGKLPVKGSVLAEKTSLCDTCPRRDSKPEKIEIERFYRVYEKEIEQDKCFLAQNIICLGPVTRGGCEGRCINANMPCRGCFGPVDEVWDVGGKFVNMLGSLISEDDQEKINQIIESIPDPAGLLYRYSLAASLLQGKPQKG